MYLSACVRMWRSQEGNGCPSLSLSAWHFDVGSLSLNLRLVLSWLDWKPTGTSDALVPVSLGAGVAGSPGYLGAGVAGVARCPGYLACFVDARIRTLWM